MLRLGLNKSKILAESVILMMCCLIIKKKYADHDYSSSTVECYTQKVVNEKESLWCYKRVRVTKVFESFETYMTKNIYKI